MTRVWISAGSNVDPEKNMRAAISRLEQVFGDVLLSPVYQTVAVGFEGDDFLNMVIGVDTALSPDALRLKLREIEEQQGRVRGESKFASRTLDLDLLTWGDLVDAGRDIPRDEILRYAFVLRPLADVAGNEVCPCTGETYMQLWRGFGGEKSGMRRVTL